MDKNLIFSPIVFAIIHFSVNIIHYPQKPNKQLLVCGDTKVLLVDYKDEKDSIPNIVWSWDSHEAMDLPEAFRLKKFNTMDDCKAIRKGEQILVSSSGGAIAIIRRKDKKVLFHAAVPNAHSIELLPGDLIAAAASTHKEGNRIMLFDSHQPDKPLFSDTLYSAHGVVWDDKRKSLFALGMSVLREYKLVKTGQPSLKKVNEWNIPGKSGHDLQPAPDGNHLFLTEMTGTWSFDLNGHTFTKIPGFTEAHDTKSVGLDKSGQFIYTVPEKSWWTYHVRFQHPTHALSFPTMQVYKARWFSEQ
ncbi:hypothetical protein IC229_06325 [Spirosoma sp. BT702]|uniref:Uncharacterized protein n=1 Tax=Spirosoma profusum TaxID=2771354 RepID=A0A927ATH6_9BACT|nr:DUF6528 family protein [Spirosoma profusum]MBD2700242.1 hypothetical protein [Spirosoma profusum]